MAGISAFMGQIRASMHAWPGVSAIYKRLFQIDVAGQGMSMDAVLPSAVILQFPSNPAVRFAEWRIDVAGVGRGVHHADIHVLRQFDAYVAGMRLDIEAAFDGIDGNVSCRDTQVQVHMRGNSQFHINAAAVW